MLYFDSQHDPLRLTEYLRGKCESEQKKQQHEFLLRNSSSFALLHCVCVCSCLRVGRPFLWCKTLICLRGARRVQGEG